ncbi:glycosyltransferase family A protein [Planomicrobium sp. CPCC 101110]|uniref:glycosyltransferase family 2 protein n=1 Tax=Planomicrobium sp. CPCC 101110 TaxID=2599619 RepID=UPI0011B508A4|nr:glycosyltransferase family A protein [Planomicrobium sp. CPCC 101110]TWT27785.1 glycosyltransferase family 2 protein [Planomicrobium sp. CPCC 101110]
MQKKSGLSMIIPIYNVEEYIEECLQSVIDSMEILPNVQIILVDDGSQDNSGYIAKKYAGAYSNFLYLLKENGGISEARNYGLEYVQYNYVAFLDSDDTIQKPFFNKIFKVLEDEPDMIIYDYVNVKEGSKPEAVKGMDFAEVLWTVQASAWNKVYKTSLFEHVKFPKDRIFEDVETIYKLLYYTNTYVYINEPLYTYRKNRKGSILSTLSSNINDIYSAMEEIYKFYSTKGALTGENQTGLCYQYVKLLCWSNMYRQLQFFKYNFWGFHLKMKETRLLLYDRFPEWKYNEHLNRNVLFFGERLGVDYIKKLDSIGKSISSTFYTTLYLVSKNRKRLS